MFKILVLFGVCLTAWFLFDRLVIEPSHMIRNAALAKVSKPRGYGGRSIRAQHQMFNSESLNPSSNQKALYDAFGKRFFNYE